MAVEHERGTPKRRKILFRYPGERKWERENMLLFISRGDFGSGPNRINYSRFNENFSKYSSARVIYIFRRCFVKYRMQHTQKRPRMYICKSATGKVVELVGKVPFSLSRNGFWA